MSEAVDHLPPDLRHKAQGIGGGARENRVGAAAHNAALEGATGGSTEPAEAEQGEDAGKVEPATLENCPFCKAELADEWNFCAKCGGDLLQDARKKLNIQFDPEDLDAYLFKGHLTKDVGIVGKSLVVRSSVASDAEKISTYLMTELKDKPVTNEFYENLKGCAAISLGIESFDGKVIGDTVKERVEWLLKLGSSLHDMTTHRVVLFNRAVTEWLQEKNSFLAS